MKYPIDENDSKLVEGCINKDLKSWSDLINKYSRLIHISVEKRLKKYCIQLSTGEIQDIKQNILASLWNGKKMDTIKNRRDISYWLSVVSGNMAIEYARKNAPGRLAKTISIFETVNEKELIDLLPSNSPDPSSEAIRKETIDRIRKGIDSLSPKESIILKLNIFHEKKHSEISEILKLPPGTIASCIKRAKEKLRTTLGDV